MVDVSGAYDGGATGVMSGIVAGTRIATSLGWREAGAIQAGDKVMTFDGGLQTVIKVERRMLWSGTGPVPERFWPLLVPAGAIENAAPMLVLPLQGVLLESDLAEEALGDPFALIPAAALEGGAGVERVCPSDPIEVISLHFETDQVVFAEHGALLFCPSGGDLVQIAMRTAARHCPYQMLPVSCAFELVHGAGAADCLSCLTALRSSQATQGQARSFAA
ncbi:MAG: Hint domain-containing protein [Paracoccaceae bacterium]